ncbi:hypothetical protein QAD02_020357 [Eretmocerus hayati]|uniref:Uncharacterized protein n=1 Tax=Eretmocerus hayati TaxID=131215 RepID=A0ACC2PLU3_9HYME|nr:hypothetical protein QAD02_020357 [Eretmocerus hayati]
MSAPIRPAFLDDPTMPEFAKALGEYMYNSQVANHTHLTSIGSSLADLTTSSHDNTRAISNLQAEVRSSRAVVDLCELRFSGVPEDSPIPDEELATKILTQMRCVDRVGPLLSVRRWALPSNRPPASNAVNPTPSQAAPGGITHEKTTSLVVKFSSPTVRDYVLSKSVHLKDATVNSIFGFGGQHRMYVSHVLPSSVYPIWRAALSKAKELNYLRPQIHNMTVVMRPDLKSPTIPIITKEDLIKLLPRQPANPPSQAPGTSGTNPNSA